MSDPMSDLTFRPSPADRPRPADASWEAVVREELLKLRRRSPGGPRVVPATREPTATREPPATREPATREPREPAHGPTDPPQPAA